MADYSFLEIVQQRRSFLLTALPVRHLTQIAYAAVRHQDNEEGAVQRLLNQSRVSGIKTFAEQGGDFPASIVLNWVKGPITRISPSMVRITEEPRSAQIIDGQHRVAGLAESIIDRPNLADTLIPVAIYEGLDTVQCANIFLSINTEQRPVPKSLVFDLFGVASEDLVDEAAVRARDVVLSLADENQAYNGLIKLPNARRQRGGIALSTAVSAIKPLVSEKGTLEQIGASSLETQKAIFQNFFNAIAEKYGDRWGELDNAFLYAAGFIGAIEFLNLKLIPYCNIRKSFKEYVISECIKLEKTDLIRQEEVKGLGGRDAPKKVYERLVSAFYPKETETSGLAI